MLVVVGVCVLMASALAVDVSTSRVTKQLENAESPALGQLGPHRKPVYVFAHYFPPYPISIDNGDPRTDYYAAEYLNPDGENGIHRAYGGLLRDRPLPGPPRSDDWRELDLAEDVKQAASAGIDGFSVDILTTHDNPAWIAPIPSLLLQMAEKTNPRFKIMLMPDMNGDLGKLTPQQMAAEMADLASSPAAFRLADGRLVVAPYIAENLPVSWWRDFNTAMRTTYRTEVALVPVFVDPSRDVMTRFAPITYGMSDWGSRSPAGNPVNGSTVDTFRDVHALSKIWMQPVSFQDYRPRDQIYDEAENTANLRNTWQIAIEGGADWVQIVTWNDYSENTAVAPSARHGTAILDLLAYYISYFKFRVPPLIDRDTVFLTHRTQLIGAKPTGPQSALAALRPGSTPGRDAVEALVLLKAPSVVTLTVGPSKTVCNAPSGLSTCVARLLQPGPPSYSVSVAVTRGDRTTVTLTSPYLVVANPPVQDLSYTMSAAREGDE